MAEKRYPRPRSPPPLHPGRSSLPSIGYDPYNQRYAGPDRMEFITTPRDGTDRANVPGPVVTTTYKIKPDSLPIRNSSVREGSRNRRSTVDNALRPTIITAQPRHPSVQGGAGGPASPVHNPYRSSDEGAEYYTIPASSGRYRGQYRSAHSATMDNADMNKPARDGRLGASLTVGSGREGARYPIRSKPIYPGSLVRHPDTVADDYGDNGYGYTNPRDLFEYDLNRTAKYPPQRRDSYEGSRPSRPLSISGYPDIAPRSFDSRERGRPPTTRGFERLPTRASPYVAPPVRMSPPVETIARSPRQEQFYEVDPLRRSSRRPVSIYQESERMRTHRDDHYDPRDDDLRDRREKPYHVKRYDEAGEQRGFGMRAERNEPNGYKKKDHDWKNDHDRQDNYDDYEEYDERLERKSGKGKAADSKKDYDERNDHERKKDYDDRPERKSGKDRVAASLSLAAGALGLSAAAKSGRHDDGDDDRDERDEPRRRRDGEEHRRRRDPRDDREPVNLTGRDPKERHSSRDDREPIDLTGRDPKERHNSRDDREPVDLTGRDPKERHNSRDGGEPVDLTGRDPKERHNSRDDREPVGLTGRDPKERHNSRDDRELAADDGPVIKERTPTKEAKAEVLDHSSRNLQERNPLPDIREDIQEPKEQRRNKSEPAIDIATLDSREDSPPSDEVSGHHRSRKERAPAPNVPFNPRNTMDLRALKEALNKQDTPAPPLPAKEPVREGAFDRRDPRELSNAQAEAEAREDRGRRDSSDSEDQRRPLPRVVSPPRPEVKKPEENKPKGILRQPREKFPEDPAPIREGVAPLKDARKDGVPPNARWTKISRRMVNPDALEAGKERYEAREDFVIVLRVLTKEEIQTYAMATQQIRAAREQIEEMEGREARRRRPEKHERHKRERERGDRDRHRNEQYEYDHEHRRVRIERGDSPSESDSTSNNEPAQKPEAPQKLIDSQPLRKIAFDEPAPAVKVVSESTLRENPEKPGTYTGYVRNPPRK